MTHHIFDFIGGNAGEWKIVKMETVIGEPIQSAPYLKIIKSNLQKTNEDLWTIKGLVSNVRYAEKEEKEKLLAIQAGLGRPGANFAALIPIKKMKPGGTLPRIKEEKYLKTNRIIHKRV